MHPDALDSLRLANALMIRAALEHLHASPRITSVIPTAELLTQATKISRKPYTDAELASAISDLTIWIETMRSALPSAPPKGLSL